MPSETSNSILTGFRIRKDIYALLKRDAGKFRGVATVNTAILEQHYAKELAAIRKEKKK